MAITTLKWIIENEQKIAQLRKEAEEGKDSAYAEYDESRYDLFIDVVETIAYRTREPVASNLCRAALGLDLIEEES